MDSHFGSNWRFSATFDQLEIFFQQSFNPKISSNHPEATDLFESKCDFLK